MDSQLSQLKSSADGVCQFKASPGMSGQPEARPLQWGPGGENSLIKFCLASSRLGPPHPHAHNLDTLGMVMSGHLWNVSQIRNLRNILHNMFAINSNLPLGSNLQKNLSLRCQTEASRIFPIFRQTREFSQNKMF